MTAAFKIAGSLSPFGGPLLKSNILANSASTTIGDAVVLSTAGAIDVAGTTGAIYGQVQAHVTSLGMGVLTTGSAGAAIGSYVGTYAVASNNVTVAQDKAQVDISKHTLYTNATSGVLGTTTGSNKFGYYFQTSDQHTLDETTASQTTTNSQYFNWGLDVYSSSLVVVSIWKSAIF